MQAEGERMELERLHNDRLSKLRQREEETMDKLRRQQVSGGSSGCWWFKWLECQVKGCDLVF